MTAVINPFRIAVTDDVLDDLRTRLRRTRWPEAELVDDWSQGAPLQWIQDVCRYWAEDYDWRKREAQLNRFAQFTTEIDGLDIHFIHVRSKHPEARPLIITHGWPGSVVEFHKVIEPLTDPTAHGGSTADAFHVVCPSLPGFGFSAKPVTTGWGVDRIARAWAVLMARLGYGSYFAQGGDWGSAVTTAIGGLDAAHCGGIHITLAMSTRPNVEGQPTPEETRALNGIKYYADWDSGYSKQQSTRPQTLGYGLTDSPSGQAAWILEKFWAWTDCDGHPENILSRDELLDNVMLYWVTATAASSARLYWESFGAKKRTVHQVSVPTGVAVFPKEIVTPVRKWMEASFSNIQHWSEMPKGGHFSAFEQPELFVGDVRKFFRTLR
ncbi:epoxide hydrolase family protein [Bradyrhizobium sp. CCBAU 51753]|uniref:epoxide hydrolase family protein n=1 Tax=Bradyrhizobium sp. CCBAU 51753 TaxID=1325100 RepID=UPI00188BD77A|nr:epoxide hydrolase family protein [Bradyrhizobium sp. CCBAU 51753]QOZ27378.1 epoxide hydrolase [Bradyrhizobium sp. CCBAU 51753]